MKQLIIYFVLCMSIVFSLLGKSDVFESNSGLSYYLTTACLLINIIYSCAYLFLKNDKMKISIIEFIIVIYLFYLIIHLFVFGGDVHKVSQLIIFLSALIAFSSFLANEHIKSEKIYLIIAIITIGELFFCILQFFGIIPTLNANFKVTGTWVNPNITAMFIALGSPSFWVFKKSPDKAKSNRRTILFYSVLFLVCFWILILLRCRTAMIGFFLTLAVMLNFSFEGRIATWKHLKSKIIKISAALAGIVIIGLILYWLYSWKIESVKGRLFIWERSVELIAKSPLCGYGYGMFEKEYNIYQANYFMENFPETYSQSNVNGYVLAAFNEYIEAWVEGGIIGLLLFLSLLFFLVNSGIYFYKKKNNEGKVLLPSLSGIIAFVAMSATNFTVICLPTFLLFAIYGAIILAQHKSITNFMNIPQKLNIFIVKTTSITILMFFIGLALNLGSIASNQLRFKGISGLYAMGEKELALNEYGEIDGRKIGRGFNYHIKYGFALLDAKQYDLALMQFKEAVRITSSPDAHYGLGLCLVNLQRFDEGFHHVKIARCIAPSTYSFSVGLMNAYFQNGFLNEAEAIAENLLQIKNNKGRKDIEYIKSVAYMVKAKIEEINEIYESTEGINIQKITANIRKKDNWGADVEKVLSKAQSNRAELEKALCHYSAPADSLKLKAMEFLVSNMDIHYSLDYHWVDSAGYRLFFDEFDHATYTESLEAFNVLRTKHPGIRPVSKMYYDMHVITAAYLIDNVERAFGVWEHSGNNFSFDIFCEYILPYRIDKEPLQLWRKKYFDIFHKVIENVSPKTRINLADAIDVDISNWFYKTNPDQRRTDPLPMLGPLHMLHRKQGECFDACALAVYAMRSQGIPASMEKIPYWATASGMHTIASVYDEKNIPHGFEAAEVKPSNFKMKREPSKVLRITYSKQDSALANKIDPSLIPGGLLKNPNIVDVTKYYWPTKSFGIKMATTHAEKTVVYICVFNNFNWSPTWWSFLGSGKVYFSDMPKGVVYLPAFYDGKKLKPASYPYLLGYNSENHLIPNHSKRIDVTISEESKYLIFRPGKKYKLFYWDNSWKEIGEKEATENDKKIIFHNVPSNALYILKPEYSKGRERPFVVNEKGERLWL